VLPHFFFALCVAQEFEATTEDFSLCAEKAQGGGRPSPASPGAGTGSGGYSPAAQPSSPVQPSGSPTRRCLPLNHSPSAVAKPQASPEPNTATSSGAAGGGGVAGPHFGDASPSGTTTSPDLSRRSFPRTTLGQAAGTSHTAMTTPPSTPPRAGSSLGFATPLGTPGEESREGHLDHMASSPSYERMVAIQGRVNRLNERLEVCAV